MFEFIYYVVKKIIIIHTYICILFFILYIYLLYENKVIKYIIYYILY